jgi:hypothetical protein
MTANTAYARIDGEESCKKQSKCQLAPLAAEILTKVTTNDLNESGKISG